MIAHSSAAVDRESEHDDETEGSVVEDGVEQHQQETDQTGAESRDQAECGQRRRHGLVSSGLSRTGSAPNFIASARFFADASVKDPEISP
jgi:hypothetical protein